MSFRNASSPVALSSPAADDYSHPFFIVERIRRFPSTLHEPSPWKRDGTPAATR